MLQCCLSSCHCFSAAFDPAWVEAAVGFPVVPLDYASSDSSGGSHMIKMITTTRPPVADVTCGMLPGLQAAATAAGARALSPDAAAPATTAGSGRAAGAISRASSAAAAAAVLSVAWLPVVSAAAPPPACGALGSCAGGVCHAVLC
jgi:hypothetical protein